MRRSSLVLIVVVVVVRSKDLLSKFLLALVDVCVEFVAVLSDRELLVVIDGDVNLAGANWLVIGVVKLGDVGMSEGLVGGQPFIWVKLE